MVLPTRKMMRAVCNRRNLYKKREFPRTLNDCLDSPADKSLRSYLMLLVLLPCAYCVYWAFNKPATVVHYYTVVDKEYLQNFKSDSNVSNFAGNEKKTLENTRKPMCVVNIGQLGPIKVNKSVASLPLSLIERAYPMLDKGGYYTPSNCRPRHRVAILVPYRNREQNLKIFLFNIHPFLMRQRLQYRVFLIEQLANETVYNKGRLYNAGYKEAKKFGDWHCLVFHDVDLLPLDDRILYSCPTFPRHMSATIAEKENYKGIYRVLFGGVTVLSPQHYEKANGYSNMYWGWGGEDHDMFWRIRSVGLPVSRYNRSIARYTSLPHPIEKKNKYRYQLLHTAIDRRKEEGLSTVEYEVIFINERPLYTHMMISVNPYNENITETMHSLFF